MGKIQCQRAFTDMQKNNAFCSICTVNHAAYAGTLNDSLKKAGHSEPHYVLIVDPDPAYEKTIEKFKFTPIYLKELKIPRIGELIKKYSAFELSNALKPFFMEWLLTKHDEINILAYLDTDVYSYSSFNSLFDHMEDNQGISVLLTPHLIDYRAYSEVGDYRFEKAFMTHGLYNGGFYVLRNDRNSREFLKWQKNKLFDHAYNGPSVQMFVDQRILDFAPILFDFVSIYKDKTYNIAHWNYSPDLIKEQNGIYYVENKRLVFFHFAQLNMDVPDITKNFEFEVTSKDRSLFKRIATEYVDRLNKNGHEEIQKIPYAYAAEYVKPPLALVDPLLAKTVELEAAQAEIYSMASRLDSAVRELADIRNSRTWKVVDLIRKAIRFIIPKRA